MGCDTGTVRNMSFLVSSATAGLAGSFFAYYLNYIDPSSFALAEMVFILTIVVVGRPGALWGVSLGTVFLVLLPEPLRFIEINSAYLGPARQLLQAVILFAVVYVNRRSLFPPQREV
jgi:branched-chain amino acid transport system permease protein